MVKTLSNKKTMNIMKRFGENMTRISKNHITKSVEKTDLVKINCTFITNF